MGQEGRSLVLFFLFIYCIGSVHSQNGVPVETGTNYTFSPSIQGTFQELDWRFIGNLLVEWDPVNGVFWYKDYQQRGSFDTNTGDLTLRVQKSDSGEYKCKYSQNSVVKEVTRTIIVMDRVPVPEVKCVRNGANVTLQCSVNPPVPARFSWRGPNESKYVGESVYIPNVSSQNQDVYFCTAQNDLGPNQKEFNLQDCPKADKQSDGSSGGAIAAGIIVPLLLLGLIAGGVYWKKKHASPAGTQGETEELKGTETSNNHPPSDGAKPIMSQQNETNSEE